MKKTFILIVLLIIFSSCKKEVNSQPTDNRVSAKEEPVKKDTLFLNDTAVVFISPELEEIPEIKKKMGEDNFYTTADDQNFYRSNAFHFLDSLKISFSNKRNTNMVAYKHGNKTSLVPLKKMEWYVLLYKNGKTKNASLVDFKKDYLSFYKNDSKHWLEIYEKNRSSPDYIINNLTFTKNRKEELEVNTLLLDYISKNTTREHSEYLIALEDYGYKNRNNEYWTREERSKIKAYIFNTSYPLRKKYWSDKFELWYTGKPEMILGSRGDWEKNDYYGLPKLEEYIDDFVTTHDWGGGI